MLRSSGERKSGECEEGEEDEDEGEEEDESGNPMTVEDEELRRDTIGLDLHNPPAGMDEEV